VAGSKYPAMICKAPARKPGLLQINRDRDVACGNTAVYYERENLCMNFVVTYCYPLLKKGPGKECDVGREIILC